MTAKRIALLSCGRAKETSARRARDLYVGPVFKKSLEYASAIADEVLILSAKHGLVRLDQVIEPYDLKLTDMDKIARRAWGERVATSLRDHVERDGGEEPCIVIVAGEDYADVLIEPIVRLGWSRPEEPLRGTGRFGHRMQWMNRELARMRGEPSTPRVATPSGDLPSILVSYRSSVTITPEEKPSVLVSYAYAKPWAKVRHLEHWREVVLDSGAFSVAKTGETIDVRAFGEWALEQKAADPRVTEVFTLDVIGGSWRESLRNTETLWKMGVEAIPVFHVGEPTDVLIALARDYPKIALGGAVGYRKRMAWAAVCFRHIWPKKVHGLGFGETSLTEIPFHTIDNSSWDFAPRQFGVYPSMRRRGSSPSAKTKREGTLPTKSTNRLNLRCEIDFFLDEEARMRRWWAGRLPEDFGIAPSIRLALTCEPHQIASFTPPKGTP